MVSITSSTAQGMAIVESTHSGDLVVMTTDFNNTGEAVQTTSEVKTIELTTLTFTTKNSTLSLLPSDSVVSYEMKTTAQVSISTPSLSPPQDCPTEGLWLRSLSLIFIEFSLLL